MSYPPARIGALLALVICFSSISCDEATAPPKPQATGDSAALKQPITAVTTPQPQPGLSDPAAKRDRPDATTADRGTRAKPVYEAPPVPPKDAQTTLYCEEFAGPTHVEVATNAKTELIKLSRMNGWYVVHQEDRSSLFFGYYGPNDERAIKRDREKIMALTVRNGDRVFRQCTLVPIDAPDPTAPQEWNLANLRANKDDTKHFITLQIAAYREGLDRKKAAVDSVRDARAQGVEAYYYHGPSTSTVSIGCWPIEALARQDRGNASLRNANSDGTLFYYTGGQLNPTTERELATAADKKGVTMMTPKLEPVDPKLIDAVKRFPVHSVNGEEEGTWFKREWRPKHSFLVEIPPRDTSPIAVDNSRGTPVPSNEAIRAVEPSNNTYAPGGGKLRGIGK